ncbi:MULTISPECIES: UDP-N-acetylglucosamine 1-carboxyvinyltransferase [Carboxydocella]|nr:MULTISPECIES: UDP-N-acetylglucosamine 1-carboxyvinyltransferase [Carboxydocella]
MANQAKLEIVGGRPLQGTITVSAAKNAALPLLAAALLTEEEVVFDNLPRIKDVEAMLEVIQQVGGTIRELEDGRWAISGRNLDASREVPNELVRKIRASNLLLGPLLARCGMAHLSMPGGCSIGSRQMDQHIKGFRALGCQDIAISGGYIKAHGPLPLQGTVIHLDVASVGATENIMMAATLAAGTTVIRNAAKEPEIVDLQNLLNKMGARIRGAGTDVIKIEGVKKLKGTSHSIIPDRIEAGTHLVAGVITNGQLTVKNIIPEHVEAVTAKLMEMGVKLEIGDDYITVFPHDWQLKAVDIRTQPYPGFPTDMQAQFMALLTLVPGISLITENIFEARFNQVPELNRLGANIKTENGTAFIKGVAKLTGAEVSATDLRAAAALALAGLAAEGKTIVENIQHLERGYEAFVEKYCQVGAQMRRITGS